MSFYVFIQQKFLLGRSEGKGHSRQREQRLGEDGVKEKSRLHSRCCPVYVEQYLHGEVRSLIHSLVHSFTHLMNVGDDNNDVRADIYCLYVC